MRVPRRNPYPERDIAMFLFGVWFALVLRLLMHSM
jgi:hypothetical protein